MIKALNNILMVMFVIAGTIFLSAFAGYMATEITRSFSYSAGMHSVPIIISMIISLAGAFFFALFISRVFITWQDKMISIALTIIINPVMITMFLLCR